MENKFDIEHIVIVTTQLLIYYLMQPYSNVLRPICPPLGVSIRRVNLLRVDSPRGNATLRELLRVKTQQAESWINQILKLINPKVNKS
jgi:hypothetical protein